MPATPPVTPPPPSTPPLPTAGVAVPGTPPTSPQRSQHAARHQERSLRLMGSPEQRRTPAPPAPLPLPTFNRQSFSNLAAQVAALPPLIPLRRTISHAQPTAGPSIPIPPPRSISAAPSHQILTSAQLAAAYAALPPLCPVRPQQHSVSLNIFLFLNISTNDL